MLPNLHTHTHTSRHTHTHTHTTILTKYWAGEGDIIPTISTKYMYNDENTGNLVYCQAALSQTVKKWIASCPGCVVTDFAVNSLTSNALFFTNLFRI